MTDFTLDPRLAADTLPVVDAPLCSIRLMNETRYPWLILVPRRAGLRELYELTDTELRQFWTESAAVSRALMQVTEGHKLNVAALGNVVAQLHIHHVVRSPDDAAWPKPVWGVHPPVAYTAAAAMAFIEKIRAALDRLSTSGVQ